MLYHLQYAHLHQPLTLPQHPLLLYPLLLLLQHPLLLLSLQHHELPDMQNHKSVRLELDQLPV
jgi:hypothetical protein